MSMSDSGTTPDSIEQSGKSGGDAANVGMAGGGYASAGASAVAVPLDPSHANSGAMGGDAMSAEGGDAEDNTSIGTININS